MSRRPLAVVVEGMYAFGGTERHAVDIACGMTARGYEVTLLSRWPLDRHHALLPELANHGVRVAPRGWTGEGTSHLDRPHVVAGRLFSLGSSTALARHAWRWERVQIGRLAPGALVHEVPVRGYVAQAAQRTHDQLRLPVVQTVLGTGPAPVSIIAPWAVVTSDCSPRLLPPDPPVMWIPTMGPDDKPRPPRQMPTDGRWRVAFAGRLVDTKGVRHLIRAWAGLSANAELIIMGDGDEAAPLANLSAALGVNATFTGRLDRAQFLHELESAHILAVPSLDAPYGEGVPTVIAEAMWAGLPVVASAVGGVERLFRNRKPGWLVPAGNEEALRDALTKAMSAAYPTAADAAPAVYREVLCPGAVLDRYEEAYERARCAVTH